MRNDKRDDQNFQNSLCITSMKQKLCVPIEGRGPFIVLMIFYEHGLKDHWMYPTINQMEPKSNWDFVLVWIYL